LPLSTDLGVTVGRLQRRALEHHDAGGRARVRAWLDGWPIDRNAVRALARLFDEQVRYAGPESLSTDERLSIEVQRDHEAGTRRYVLHSTYGRRVNEGLARLLGHMAERETGGDVGVVVADNGVVLTMALNRKLDVRGLLADIDPEAVRGLLRDSLTGSDLLKRHFRIVATRSLMLLKRYKGQEKSASQQQVASETLLEFARTLEDFAPMTETNREILEDTFAVGAIEQIIERIQEGSLALGQVTVDSPSPRAFGLATLSASDVVLESDEQRAQLEYHRAVLEAIGETAPETAE
jgi:ATP-dependent Lhr-like helicase